MARASASEVKQVYNTDLDDTTIEDWIDVSNELVNDRLDGKLSESLLKRIEIQLAAHFASAQDQRAESVDQQSTSVDYQGETGMGLKGTKYGQNALALDTTGALANSNKPGARFEVR